MRETWRQTPCIIGTEASARRAWRRLYGDPKPWWVLHHCNRHRCHEPRHLYLGTRTDNERDRRLADPSTVAEDHPTYVVAMATKVYHHSAGPSHSAIVAAAHVRRAAKAGTVLAPRCKACGKSLRPRLWHKITGGGDRYHSKCPLPPSVEVTATMGWEVDPLATSEPLAHH